jgi:hypothetical protein
MIERTAVRDISTSNGTGNTDLTGTRRRTLHGMSTLNLVRGRSRSRYDGLRDAIQDLSVATAAAMLQGVQTHRRVICGAYVLPDGGACPMLIAQRAGAPSTPFLEFHMAWDRFCRLSRLNQTPRVASWHERRILVDLLQRRVMPGSEITRPRAARRSQTTPEVPAVAADVHVEREIEFV